MKKVPLTHAEHSENALDLAIIHHYLNRVFNRCDAHYPKTHPVMDVLRKVVPGIPSNIFSKITHLLDEEYHKVTTEDEFKQAGHVYYSLSRLYEDKVIR